MRNERGRRRREREREEKIAARKAENCC